MSGKNSTDTSIGPQLGRRRFMTGVAVGAVAIGTGGTPAPAAAARSQGGAKAPTPAESFDVDGQAPPLLPTLTTEMSGSDYMVDVIKSLGIDYLAANPGSSFRGLQESIINYGGNSKPEFLTCCHEEASVAMAHGYAKAAGKPMAAMVHGVVGVQHASMAIYNAFCDRVPVLLLSGNAAEATLRRPGAEWDHSAQDNAAMIRDFVKWDDQPASLRHFGESLVRGYKLAVTPPMAPVMITADTELQEGELDPKAAPGVPKLGMLTMPAADPNALREVAKMLVGAENPVILVDRYARTPAAMGMLITLAETLQAPVCDLGGRMNFPNTHHLSHSPREVVSQADVILGIETPALWGATHKFRDQLHRSTSSGTRDGVKLVSIGMTDFMSKSNYQDFQRYTEVDISIAGDGEESMPMLIDAVRRAIPAERRAALAARGQRLKEAHVKHREGSRLAATHGWDASPVSTARICQEVWALIQHSDWVMGGDPHFMSDWPQRLWTMDKHYRHIGRAGGAGVGYGLPSAIGCALAHRDSGRIVVNFQGDGDLMYSPGALWTAAHHRIPLLTIVHNNRAYHQELMHLQRMANRHNRGTDRAHIGTTLTDPNIDYATMARSMGMAGFGPVSSPADLAPALKKAIAVVKRGEPALVDVVSQPR